MKRGTPGKQKEIGDHRTGLHAQDRGTQPHDPLGSMGLTEEIIPCATKKPYWAGEKFSAGRKGGQKKTAARRQFFRDLEPTKQQRK